MLAAGGRIWALPGVLLRSATTRYVVLPASAADPEADGNEQHSQPPLVADMRPRAGRKR